MDQTLVSLFEALCSRIDELKKQNPSLDMEDVERGAILIQSYLDGFKIYTPKEPVIQPPPPLQQMSYEDICKLTRPPRTTPEGHAGPSYLMAKYADSEDNRRARQVDAIIQYGKELDKNKNKPFFS